MHFVSKKDKPTLCPIDDWYKGSLADITAEPSFEPSCNRSKVQGIYELNLSLFKYTGQSSCGKPQDLYRPRHNQSKHNLSRVGGLLHPDLARGVPQPLMGDTRSWPGQGGTPSCPGWEGYPILTWLRGPQDWGTPWPGLGCPLERTWDQWND